jgi:hypothetical protein
LYVFLISPMCTASPRNEYSDFIKGRNFVCQPTKFLENGPCTLKFVVRAH